MTDIRYGDHPAPPEVLATMTLKSNDAEFSMSYRFL
jgi:hypothetical protein